MLAALCEPVLSGEGHGGEESRNHGVPHIMSYFNSWSNVNFHNRTFSRAAAERVGQGCGVRVLILMGGKGRKGTYEA